MSEANCVGSLFRDSGHNRNPAPTLAPARHEPDFFCCCLYSEFVRNDLLYQNNGDAGSWLFFIAIILMIVSMVLFTLEIQIGNLVLDVHLSDLEKHQEWKDYLKSKKRRLKSTAKLNVKKHA